MKQLCVYLLLVCAASTVRAQIGKVVMDSSIVSSNDTIPYTIGSIILTGNKKTKNYIVLREVTIREGQTFSSSNLAKQLELTREQVMNTALFVDVAVSVSANKNNFAEVKIALKERWYLFPLPYFKLVDRNFNQWWSEQKASLDRVNYGLKFFYNNVSGRNDKVSLDLVNGYNQQIAFGYTQPFADKSLTKGFGINFNYSRQRELNYNTIDDKQAFYKQPDFVRETVRGSASYTFRPDSKYRYYIRAGYAWDNVSDTILKLNPNYFPEGKTSVSYMDLGAGMQYYNVDYIPFPKKGFMYEANISHRGLGLSKTMNQFALSFEITNAVSFTQNTFIQFHNLAMVRFPFNQPFYNQGLLGYGDAYLRGLESYVQDGSIGLLSNTTLYQKLFTYVFKNPIKTKTHDRIPFTFYLKAFGDMGYAYNKYKTPNILSNTFLHTTGIGLDVVSIYDFVFRLEYSFNQKGEQGPAFRTRGDF